MKINIGCGKKYEPGYINIDLYESLVADQLMSAMDLRFEDNSSEEIIAIQIIEHFSFFETIYVLSEFYRVLMLGGKLRIETPDLNKACQNFVNSNDEQKKEILGWLYGIPHKGLQHKLCYPPFLLTELLENVGFDNIHLSFFDNEESIPSVRFECNKREKAEDFEIYQTISHLRKDLRSQDRIDFNDSFSCKEQEDIISFIGSKLLEMKRKEKTELLYKLFLELLIKWPDIVGILLKVIKDNAIVSKIDISNIKNVATILIEQDIVNILYNRITEGPLNPGTQKIVFYSVELFGKKLIENLLYSKENRSNLIDELKKLNTEFNESQNKIFSATLVEQKALDFYYLGMKAFYQENYPHAYNMFLRAIQFNRNNYKFFWYLGKALIKLKSFDQAKKVYKKTLRLIKMTSIRNKQDLKSQIQHEITLIEKNNQTLK